MPHRFDVLTMGRSSIDLYAHQIGVPITSVTSFDAYVGGCPTNIYRADQWRSREEYESQVLRLVSHAHLAIGTEDELAAATDDRGRAAAGAERLLAGGPDAFVLKRGAEGARVYERGQAPVDVAPFRIEVLNVLGAGDAFAAGLLYGLRRGWTLARAARVGNATGAIIVTRHGCANFMPTCDEVESFVAQRGGWKWESVA